MTRYIKYVTDEFLKEFKSEFLVKYAHLYKSNEMDKLKSVFSDPNHVIETSIEYEYEPLEVEPKDYDADIVRRNIRRVWESLKALSPVQAEMEKIWVALAHTDYLEYQMGIFNSQIANPDNKKREESSLKSRTIFVNGAKRSLAIHNLAILWWLAYYFRDDKNIENPYHLIVRILDTLTREEVKDILIKNLPNSHKVSFANDKVEDEVSLEVVKGDNQGMEITALEQPIKATETDSNIVTLRVAGEEAITSVSETNKVADLPVLELTTQQEETEDDDMLIAPV